VGRSSLEVKISLEQRLTRFTEWFHRRNDRPLLGFYLDSQYPLHRYRGAASLPAGPVEPSDVIVARYLDDCDRLFDLYERAGGDFIWSAAPFFGLPWAEAALGCGVIADHVSGSTRSVPPEGFADDPMVPEFSEGNPWIAKMVEFYTALERRSAGRYPVGVTLLRGVSDVLSALYGGERFLIAMIDDPKAVKAVAEKVADFLIALGSCMLDHAPLFHGGTGSFFYSCWCPGKTIWLQEDAAALLSPRLYDEFIYPPYCRIADSFAHSAVHLHPSKFMPVDFLLRSRTDVIELHMDRGGPSAEELSGVHTKILSAKPLLIWGDATWADLEFILRTVPHSGLAVNMVASSAEEAEDVWDRASRLWDGRPRSLHYG
jgi:hypothetical protein